MKKNAYTVFALLGAMLLTSCGGNDPSKERIITKDVYTIGADLVNVTKAGTLSLLYKANSDIPYISLTEGVEYLNTMRQAKISKDNKVTLKEEEDKATYLTSDETSCVLDFTNQTVTYSDFDGFNNHVGAYKNTLAVVDPEKDSPIHIDELTYTKGNSYSISLKDYSQIDIYKHDGHYYLPLTTYNDLFINPISLTNLIYDFDKCFYLPTGVNFAVKNEEGEEVLTPLGEAFYYSREANPTVSKAYAEYNYQNICLNFNHLYGVKGVKGRDYTSFDAYLSSKGYKEDLLSGDVHKMDNAYIYALSSLKDGHTAVSAYSPLYKFGTANPDKTKLDPEGVARDEEEEKLNLARMFSGAGLGFTVDAANSIAYIAFNEFSSLDVNALKKGHWSEAELENSATLFAYAYKEITEKYLGDVTYVAVDLATNDGGAADGLLYMLGLLLGKFTIETQDPFTGAHNKTTYSVDINLDGVVDEKDISLREYGKTIVFIDTTFAFSCGNALPVFAKLNYPDSVVTIGETTGGGTCVVRTAYTALGTQYSVSGLTMLSKRDGEKLTNIEDGVKADIDLARVMTINRKMVVDKLTGKIK